MFALKKMITAAALAFAAVHAQAVPTLTVSSPTVTNGGMVNVDVSVADISDLFGYGLSVNYNAAVLSFAGVTSGSFLGTAGTTNFGFIPGSATGVIDYIYDALNGNGAGASGSGKLFTISFNTLAAGTSQIGFTDPDLFNSALDGIAFTTVAGAVTVLPPPVTPPAGVPEPTSALLLGIGAAAFLARRRSAAKLAA